MQIQDYLAACGVSDISEVRPYLWQFRLPGDRYSAGRATTTRQGVARIWHRGARAGLALSDKWQPAAPVQIKSGEAREVPSYVARLMDLATGDTIAKIDLPERGPALVAPDDEVRAAALALLTECGWRRVGEGGKGIVYLNDGTGSTPACRLLVRDGIASVWSFRGDLNLPAPWRPGRTLKTGERTMYATGHDLGVAASVAHGEGISLLPTPSDDSVDQALAARVVDWWQRGALAPADHRHLTKSGAHLVGEGLRLAPADAGHPGDLMVPLLRPTGEGAVVDVSGAQRLCSARTALGTDKFLVAGTRLAGSFVPVPLAPALASMCDGRLDLTAWVDAALRSPRPLVVCEGVASALAIHESGAGYAIAAMSSSNVGAVARWLVASGVAARFPAFVIATDYDVALRNGKPVSRAIKKALAAASESHALIAIPSSLHRPGTDARDLYAQGAWAVRDYIDSAVPPEQAAKRLDVRRLLAVRGQGMER